jgi:catechol 2,3-dioxygenase-like lactoylglutathione lyase family enzyme
MAGIVFLGTTDLDRIKDFYVERVGMDHWLAQEGIAILRHENMLIGFQKKSEADTDALLTFYYPERSDVDRAFARFKDEALHPPRERPQFRIYNFFARDPEGRMIEFQTFLHELPEGPQPWGSAG